MKPAPTLFAIIFLPLLNYIFPTHQYSRRITANGAIPDKPVQLTTLIGANNRVFLKQEIDQPNILLVVARLAH